MSALHSPRQPSFSPKFTASLTAGVGVPWLTLQAANTALVLRRAWVGRRACGRIAVSIDTQVVQDRLGRFRGWDDGDDFHVAATLVALENIDSKDAAK